MSTVAAQSHSPVCVPLDRSVIRTNLLHESMLLLIKRNVLYVFLIAGWFCRGRAVLEREVIARTHIDAASLPYNDELIDWLRSQRHNGRPIWLFSSAPESHGEAIAAHLGIFERVFPADSRVQRQLTAQFRAQIASHHRRGKWAEALRALRPHQWIKNVLLFIPLLAAHRVSDAVADADVLLGFVAFLLCASSVYVLNDLLDLEADRRHLRKRHRPFASGALPLVIGFYLAPALLLASAAVALALPPRFSLVLAVYYFLTLGYSLVLKRVVILDATVLAALYTLRVIAGAAAADIPLSFWLLLFATFLFLSLAFVKRYAEVESLQRRQQAKVVGRGYDISDLPMLEGLGIAAGYMSVLVLALYINSPTVTVLYRRPELIWPLCALLLYWISRIWMKTHRGRMHDDPVIFALRGRISLVIATLCAGCLYAAI